MGGGTGTSISWMSRGLIVVVVVMSVLVMGCCLSTTTTATSSVTTTRSSSSSSRKLVQDSNDDDGTAPILDGVVNPLVTGAGRGVGAAAATTQQVADLLGDTIATLLHTVDGVAANTEQGTGASVADIPSALQAQHNKGLVADVLDTLAG